MGKTSEDRNEDQTREYMISRAKTCLLNGDSSYAKSWIMSANALFPQNDKIKMESYEMSKCEANVEEAVKYLCEMFDTKDCEQQLTQELNKILISCRNEWQTHHFNDQQIQSVFGTQSTNFSQTSNQFYSKLFGHLSAEYQYKLLRRVADRTEDKLILIDLLLFTLKRFPESVVEIGVKLIEIMDEKCITESNTESTDESKQHLNQYFKKKLVFDVLPLIFADNSKLSLNFETIQRLMQKTLKYFVERLIAPEIDSNGDSNHKQTAIGGNKDNEELLEKKIKEIFQLIGRKNEWKLFLNIDFINEKHFEVIYDKISHFIDEYRFRGDTDSPMDLSSASTALIGGDEQTNQQILYATVVLFLQCLYKYSKLSSDIILIEETKHALNETKITIPLNKKRKLTEPELLTSNPELKQLFVVASKALKLLQENLTINSDFSQISEEIGLNSCQTYHSFVIDAKLLRAEYNEMISLLNRKIFNLKSILQLISVSLMLHDYNSTLKHVIESIEFLPLKNTISFAGKDSALPKGTHESDVRRLYFLPLNLDNILSYLIEVIILCLKDRVLLSLKPSDLGVGHLLVLSQHKWPNNIQLYLTCMSFIRKGVRVHGSQTQPKFTYHQFFSYVFIPDIIEDFMNIIENKEILFELKPNNSALGTPLKTSSKVITTRGVNKGFKEENRSALLQQMNSSKSQIQNEMFIEFINKEIRSFLQSIH